MSPSSRPISVVLAGGGTAGHIEPALAVAEAVRRARPDARVTALGTTRGLETTLVPARGVDLELIPAVPVPRKVNRDLFTLPFRLVGALRRTRRTLKDLKADVVVGFGGYVSAPAYLAARSLGVPVVVHEANARAGMSNKLGVRLGGRALAATADSGLDAEVVGIPVRESLLTLDRAALRDEARDYFGLDRDRPVLLVTGGSQGAASINSAVAGAAGTLADAGIGVLHAYGRKNEAPSVESVEGAPAYVAVPYIERMDLALAAADMVLCRSGAMTVAEISACGLPAVYVPLPHGNGEQELNARPVVAADGGVIVPDAELDAGRVAREVVPLLRDSGRLQRAGDAAAAAGHRDAAERIAQIVISEAGE
ncbi:undecaprenyldiphospho-muramoylpentapeptide beta-N-acetylglucosaminyltransferase [Corynebacterium sp.]|uniref:undecaprenyldiphospho-muramoylpentapeptide beta-N-acetylglucosaminyltransferase n=1 Tax=Corynebacterium sp. TaxID=1720 RepID=UPI0025C06C63|nr:undecaprenyldiphospho-muramoylpentapeptide beta-N-acetylglucosaminyltransferase [Corynebacterium sp.]